MLLDWTPSLIQYYWNEINIYHLHYIVTSEIETVNITFTAAGTDFLWICPAGPCHPGGPAYPARGTCRPSTCPDSTRTSHGSIFFHSHWVSRRRTSLPSPGSCPCKPRARFRPRTRNPFWTSHWLWIRTTRSRGTPSRGCWSPPPTPSSWLSRTAWSASATSRSQQLDYGVGSRASPLGRTWRPELVFRPPSNWASRVM